MRRAIRIAIVLLASTLASANVVAQLLGPKLEAKPTVAPAIPGVTAAGEKVALIQDGLPGSDGIVSLRDGTPVFIEQNSPRIRKINPDDTISTLVEEAGVTSASSRPKSKASGSFRPTTSLSRRTTASGIYMTDAGALMKPPLEEHRPQSRR